MSEAGSKEQSKNIPSAQDSPNSLFWSNLKSRYYGSKMHYLSPVLLVLRFFCIPVRRLTKRLRKVMSARMFRRSVRDRVI